VSDDDFYLMFNASNHQVSFTVPRHPRGLTWNKVLDTGAAPPGDIGSDLSCESLPHQNSVSLVPRSMVVLLAPCDEVPGLE